MVGPSVQRRSRGLPRKRREKRCARWCAYHCCFARLAECLRLRLPSGMAFPFSSWFDRLIDLCLFERKAAAVVTAFWPILGQKSMRTSGEAQKENRGDEFW